MGYGVKEWGEFPATLTGAGVHRIWDMRREFWTFRAGEGSPEGLHSVFERETKELGEKEAGRRACERSASVRMAEMVSDGRLPVWRAVTGVMTNDDLEGMHPEERFSRFARLIRAVERVVRFEWRAFRKKRGGNAAGIPLVKGDPTPGPSPLTRRGDTIACDAADGDAGGQSAVAPSSREAERMASSALFSERHGAGPRGEGTECGDASHLSLSRQDAGAPINDDPRVSWWDPLRTVCEQFGMAYSGLSRVCREIAGLSASDVSDRVKAEGVRAAMRADVKRWMLEINQEHPELKTMKASEALEAAWDYLQAKRGRGKGSRASWACAHGFSSYTRFHKACLAGLGVSPIELERDVLEEVFEEGERLEGASPGADLERGAGIQNSNIKIQNGEDSAGIKEGDGDTQAQSH